MNKYFSHDCNARNDDKIIALRMKYGWEGYGIYWAIVEKLRDSSNYTCVKDYNLIAFDLRSDAAKIKSIIEDFGLFAFTEDGKCIYSESLMRRMEIKNDQSKKLSEAGKKGNEIRWAIGRRSGGDRVAIANKEKESKENIIPPTISNEIVSPPIGEPGETIDSGKEAEQTRIKLSQQEKEKNCGKREKEFYDQLVPWVSVYGPDMIRKFFDYWRERNKSRTKMRFELQPTWDLAGRLRTWEQKQNDYGKRGKTSGSSSEQDDAELMQHIAAGYARGMQERENR